MSGTFFLAMVSTVVFATLVTMFVRRSNGVYVDRQFAHYYNDPDAVRRAWEAQQAAPEPDEPRGPRLVVDNTSADEGAA